MLEFVGGDDDGSVKDSKRDRAPFVGVSVVPDSKCTRLRGVVG